MATATDRKNESHHPAPRHRGNRTLLRAPHRAHRGAVRAPPRNGRAIRHVIFISIDTLRADHLGCYGHPFVKSPHIDRLAAEGVRFTNHFSAVSTTLSSHTTMMTGTYPHTHGVVRNGFVVHGDNLMMAEILGRAGFKTAGFVGAHPLFPATSFSQGFDHFDAPISAETGGEQRRAHQVTDAVLD